jgi:hypothetical protein
LKVCHDDETNEIGPVINGSLNSRVILTPKGADGQAAYFELHKGYVARFSRSTLD